VVRYTQFVLCRLSGAATTRRTAIHRELADCRAGSPLFGTWRVGTPECSLVDPYPSAHGDEILVRPPVGPPVVVQQGGSPG